MSDPNTLTKEISNMGIASHFGKHKVHHSSEVDYSVDSTTISSTRNRSGEDKSKAIARNIQKNILGRNLNFTGPYGTRPITYCDYIASGKPLEYMEKFIDEQVLPFYANTHTTTTATALQTTQFRNEARDIVRNATNASEGDAVIFTGSGVTGAIHKLIHALRHEIKKHAKTLVFVSLMEHHSNLLPWREEPNVEIITIFEDQFGRVDLEYLRQSLIKASKENDALLIGAFSITSNITGIMQDDLAITALLHQYGALSFWDYAAAAPYVNIDVNPKIPEDTSGLLAKDAVYFSGHKFVGGPQTPGVLICKKKLMSSRVPSGCGGGTVFFVTGLGHRFLKDIETREEGGTPDIVGSIRFGLVMQLKMEVGPHYIMKREREIMFKVRQRLGKIPNFLLLGNQELPRISVISFVIQHSESGSYIHHNFVCALLNDLFGIQARGGCACAGPYAEELLGIDVRLAKEYEDVIAEDSRLDRDHLRRRQAESSSFEILRPGFSRLNLSWFASDKEIDFILDALELISTEGWKLLPQYKCNNETGEWRHFDVIDQRKWLGNISYNDNGEFRFIDKHPIESTEPNFVNILEKAKSIIGNAKKDAMRRHIPDQTLAFSDEKSKKLRWFLLPCEARTLLSGFGPCKSKIELPFNVKSYSGIGVDDAEEKIPGTLSQPYYLSQDLEIILHAGVIAAQPEIEHSISNMSISSQQNIDSISSKEELDHSKNPYIINNNSETQNEDAVCTDGMCLPATNRTESIAKPLVKAKWCSPPKEIFKPFLEAIDDFQMVKDGDRILVCLSGGKDSLSLLHTMKQYQYYAKSSNIKFDLGAVTVDPLSSAYDPRPLIPYLEQLGVPYFYEEQAIMQQALEANCSSICAFCSRMKRGRLYAAARREGYTVLAMGQHLDDLAESFFMSVFHNGRLRTMKANYQVQEGDLRVIRPLAYVRERHLRSFAEKSKLPVIAENCPACFESPKERHRTKQVLAQQELIFPKLYSSLKGALGPLMNVRKTGIEKILFGKINGNTSELNTEETDDEDVSSNN